MDSDILERGEPEDSGVLHRERVYAFAAVFFDALVAAGVRHVVVSPGSRSTPLTLAAAAAVGLELWVHSEERGAGFFALGLARASRTPVACICTSGSAAANYLPAVVEAYHGGVPLLLLTADRPPEAQDWGAAQTIDQVRLFGSFTRWFHQLPVLGTPAAEPALAAALAARSVAAASHGPPGPVHLNWPLREPLEPPGAGVVPRTAEASGARAGASVAIGRRSAAPCPEELADMAQWMGARPRGVVVCGPADFDGDAVESIVELGRLAGLPILADATSQLRCGPHSKEAGVVAHADALVRDAEFAGDHHPEWVLQIGGSPSSKPLRRWLEAAAPERWVVVDPDAGWREPALRVTDVLRCDPGALCHGLARRLSRTVAARGACWSESWRRADTTAARAIEAALAPPAPLREAAAVRAVSAALPDGALLYVSNSMPVRDLDAFLPRATTQLRVLCHRGANGIDGLPSAAMGAAAAGEGPVCLLTGDLAFLHDLSGWVAAARHQLPLTVVVLNNDGGGIFSLLPLGKRAMEAVAAEQRAFESLFRTPHGLDLEAAADLVRARFARVTQAETLSGAVRDAIASHRLSLIEVPIDRDASVAQHAAIAVAVRDALSRERLRA